MELAKKLRLKPRKPKANEIYRIDKGPKNLTHQADLLFLPPDGEYKYALVVADVGTRLVDAEPITGKSSKAVLEALNKIYSRKTIQMPKRIKVDFGTEFKGEAEKYLDKHNVEITVGKPGRHKMQAIVESKNKTIGEKLFERMQKEQLITGHASDEWVSYLPTVIKTMNAKTRAKNKKEKLNDKQPVKNTVKVIFDIGDQVRVKADEPFDPSSGKRLRTGFRATDFRWHPLIRTVKDIHIHPYKPPLYILDDPENPDEIEMVGYSGYELQPVSNDESFGDAKDILLNNKVPDTFIVEKILNKKKKVRTIYYLVKYRGYKEPSWEKQSGLVKNSHSKELIDAYEKKQLKKDSGR